MNALLQQNESRERKPLPQWFPPGVSGNPAGRKKGSRNRLSEDFLGALSDDFAEHGAAAIRACREGDPATYVKVVASILPKEFIIERSTDGLTDEQLGLALDFIRSVLSSGGHESPGGGTTIEGIAEPAGELQTLPKAD